MYIDPYVKILKQYETVPNLRIVLIVEPDSLPNMATNLNVPKCATVNEVYRESVSYAIKNLATVQNVAMVSRQR
jgi:cellulose 1,4-beta-cellobiosidase